MGKAVKAIGIGVAIIGLAVLTGGISLAPTLTGSLAAGTAAIGTALTTTALGGLALSLGAGMILTGFSTLMRSTPRIPLGHLDRLNASLNPTAPRTIVFGETALGTDIRYVYPSGAEQRYIDYIIGHACHKLESIDEVWSEDRKAWTSAGGYQGWTVVGGVNRLTITTRLEGSAANAINVGGAWAGTARLTGCAYSRLWIDRQGTKKTDSPFAGGLATRLTFRGKGMPLYDPRLDSTNGGSGTHRPDDQTTWGTASGRDNPVLQILAYLLGWRIGGKLSVGRGVPPERLDLASFITAANVCDESVALAGGGTQARYRTAGIFNEADDTNAVLSTLLTSCAGELRETGGKLGIYVLTNDLASPVAYFDDNNILSQFEWSGEADLTETPNVVRGRYTDPSDNALYNLVDYPEHSIASLDGVERVLTLDLPAVQDGRRAQRIAKQALQRAQYTGTFSAEFDIEAWKCTVGNIVALSLEPMGWSNKLFRVVQMAIRQDGRVPMVLREENAAIYAWAADESAVVEAATPTTFDPLNSGAILAAVEAATTANWSGVNDDGGKPENNATRNVDRGPWSSASVVYSVGDEVQSQGSTWGAKVGHVSDSGNGPPALPTTENTNWRLRAAKGDAGASGTDGDPGYTLNVAGNVTKVAGQPASLDCAVTGGAWGHGSAYSSQVYVNGAALWFNTPNTHGSAEVFMIGLNDNPSSGTSYTDIDHALQFRYAGPGDYRVDVWENGTQRTLLTGGSYRAWSYTNKYGITYDGRFVRYWEINGTTATKLYENDVGANKAFGLDVAAYARLSLTNIAFSPKGADGLDAVTVSPPSVAYNIACDSAGNPKAGEFNKVTTFSVLQGTVDLSDHADTDYSVANTNCSATMGGTNGKVLTQTAMSAQSAKSVVTIQRSGVTVATVDVSLTKALEGAASRRALDKSISAPSSTSYGAANGGTLEMALDTGETANVSFAATYTATSAGTFFVSARIEYREKGSGTWLLLDSEAAGSAATYLGDPGDVSIFADLAGSGGLKVYEFQLLLKRSNTGPTMSWNPGNFLVSVF